MIPALIHPRAVLLHGEALATMRAVVRDKSMNLVCTDPPYGEHTHANMGKDRRKDGGKESEELWFPPLTHEFVRMLAAEFVRICTGWIIIFTDDRTAKWWGDAIEEAGGRWVRTGHWVKTNPKPQMSADRPSVGTETIVIAHSFPPGEGKMVWHGGGRTSVWRGNRDPEGLHPNQKPLWLMQELLGLFADPGANVIDPFAGSASTGVAALATARIPGLLPPEHECKACAKKAMELEGKRAPLPVGYSFLGIEGHAATLQIAKTRLERAIQGATP